MSNRLLSFTVLYYWFILIAFTLLYQLGFPSNYHFFMLVYRMFFILFGY